MDENIYSSQRWKRKRQKILRRDGYMCQRCKRYGRLTPATIVHHVKEIDQYPELAFTDSNLESVCMACHNVVHPEKGTKGRKAANGKRQDAGEIRPD